MSSLPSVGARRSLCALAMVDSIYRTRSLGMAAKGLPNQYADGHAARIWQLYFSDMQSAPPSTRTGWCHCCAPSAATQCSTWTSAPGESHGRRRRRCWVLDHDPA
ncbi:Hypothetical predicted protein [Podarcis lilfordi]|uniref:Uncharacterized protein n=1 Tax=Podarcis lilfordi TaxID=74358 RepID=A0AA35LB30_9SAUR|nr:Hypothetical predicted protein [Podarcis lilfordi]